VRPDRAFTVVTWRWWVVLGLVGGLTLLAACGGDDAPEGYSRENRADFVDDCTTGDISARTCGCFYDRLALQVPFDRFEQLEERLRDPMAPTNIPADVAGMAAACAAQDEATDGG
jgi:hypothetical protein